MGSVHVAENVALRKTIAEIGVQAALYRLEDYVAGVSGRTEPLDRLQDLSTVFSSDGVQAYCDLSNDAVKLTIGLGFYGSDLRGVVSKSINLPEERVTPSIIQDFAREYLNVVLGGVKKLLGAQGVDMNMGIPDSYVKESALSQVRRGLEFVEGYKVLSDQAIFEIKVCVGLVNPQALAHVKPQDVKQFFETKQAEVDIDSLFDAL